jgi:hypothetical protein
MARKTRIRIVGKRATFDVEAWARAVEALARQLHREAQETAQLPPVPDGNGDGGHPS